MDVDHFKMLNDEYGHAFGDHVLATVAGLLKEKLRSTDVVARYGGEEFVIIFFDTSKASALAVAEGLSSHQKPTLIQTTFEFDARHRERWYIDVPKRRRRRKRYPRKTDEAMYTAKKNS